MYKQFPNNFNKFSNLHAQCKVRIKIDYVNYLHKVQISVSIDPKYFWMFINNKHLTSSFPMVMSHNNIKYSWREGKKLQTFFLNIFQKFSIHQPLHHNIFLISIAGL